ncbi:uncharacterized protein LOC110446604 [Mizuhopecten yessoensis]|uniref:Uncharacterized protein n=1 Tax=Mizuhopecten yessoensis TaxID=6573 RepID=A0A210QX02_MIZYE|nr:uncharacterized protein LOC110446604 [Mizuhopecten yessoensis]OWF53290.1 hypothetical protein KP79_PYT10977 [Mizuhopecten yessoensis]
MGLYLKPSEIRYTQATISGVFRQTTRHKNTQIGKTLDDILVASSSIDQIPKITVCKKNGQWYSFDNRRLWIFKKLEKYGICSKILVKSKRFKKIKFTTKFTTKSDGTTVELRGGDAGGTYWRQQEELVNSHHSDLNDSTAELHNNSKKTETKRTPSAASLTTRSVHGDGAENLSDLKYDISSWPSSAVLDLYFPIMLESSGTPNRNGLDKADTNLKLPETSDGSYSTFNDSHYDETRTLPVSPEKSDDGPDSTLGDFHNDLKCFPVSQETSDDSSDSTSGSLNVTLPLSQEMRVCDSDSTLYDSNNPETSSMDTTLMSPVLTDSIADTELLGLRLADLGLRFLSAGFSTHTVMSTSENKSPTLRSSSEYGGGKKKKRKKKKK